MTKFTEMNLFPASICRIQSHSLEEADLHIDEHLIADIEANFMLEGYPEMQNGGLKVRVLLPGQFAEQPLRHLEQLADEHVAALLEAIAAELRKRAAPLQS